MAVSAKRHKWEYLHISGDTFDHAISSLRANGDDGWELVNVCEEKRRIEDVATLERYTFPFWHALYKRLILCQE